MDLRIGRASHHYTMGAPGFCNSISQLVFEIKISWKSCPSSCEGFVRIKIRFQFCRSLALAHQGVDLGESIEWVYGQYLS